MFYLSVKGHTSIVLYISQRTYINCSIYQSKDIHQLFYISVKGHTSIVLYISQRTYINCSIYQSKDIYQLPLHFTFFP